MDTLHSVLRALQPESKAKSEADGERARKDHLMVFREFLAHLDKVHRKAPAKPHRATRRSKAAKRTRKS